MSTLRVSVVSKLSILVVLCAVLALAFVPKTARAISMAQPEYGFSAANINMHLMDNSGYVHNSNYTVALNIPVGGWVCAKRLTFDAFGQSLSVPPHKYARLILTIPSVNLPNMRVKSIYSPNSNIVIGLSYDAAYYGGSNERSTSLTVDLYNESGDYQEVMLGGYDDMICANNPAPYSSAVDLVVSINTFVVYKNASSNAQNELAQEEKNAHTNIKNQDKGGDNNNNPTGKSQTLMDYFKNGISAIQKMKKTNCNLKLDIGVVKFDEVDMCKLKVPSYVKIISSILVFTVCVPASIAIVRRIVAVIKEMQQ